MCVNNAYTVFFPVFREILAASYINPRTILYINAHIFSLSKKMALNIYWEGKGEKR
jgi:hypothetical protein